MNKEAISSANAPAALGPYSSAVKVGDMLYLSGQLGLDPATGKLPEGVEAQAEQSLKNIEAVLAEVGATTANIVKTTVFMADIADFARVNEVYAKHFEAPYPARSAVQVAALPAAALIEIEVVAAP